MTQEMILGEGLFLEDISKLLSPVDSGEFLGVYLTLDDYVLMCTLYINKDLIPKLLH